MEIIIHEKQAAADIFIAAVGKDALESFHFFRAQKPLQVLSLIHIYANPDATKEEVVQAAVLASAHDFICKMPDGYDTIIGATGRELSGGERQRISIARAILANPRILILDEATASVDTETEKAIQASINFLIKGRTTISIAHRLSTLRDADRLVVMDEGRITEEGSHEELLARKGTYFKLRELQTKALAMRGLE